jgi:hypothetical protein
MRTIKDVGHFLHLEKEELLDVYDDILASLRSNGDGIKPVERSKGVPYWSLIDERLAVETRTAN